MEKALKRIGIYGGTFDPIHYGHLMCAQNIKEMYDLDKVIFVPSGIPPHKNLKEVTSAKHRFNMVWHAIDKNPCFEVSDVEIQREGYTYSVDTIKLLRKKYKDEALLFYIIGADVVLDLLNWKDCHEVFKLCSFIAALRPGYKKERVIEYIKYLKSAYNADIYVTEVPLIQLSSTDIRNRVKKSKSVKYYIPERVEEYIIKKSLYSEDEGLI